jgi:hypothetical protein
MALAAASLQLAEFSGMSPSFAFELSGELARAPPSDVPLSNAHIFVAEIAGD